MNAFGGGYRTLSEEVYNGILFRISEGVWNSGEKLPSEGSLCKMFGVSRASIRAAIQRLQAQGIVETRPGIGSFVIVPDDNKPKVASGKLSSKEFREFFEFRQAIEFKAVELFVMRADERDYHRVEFALKQMESSEDNMMLYSKWDMEFHMAIIEGAHNRYIKDAMEAQKEMYAFFLTEINCRDSKRSFKERTVSHRLSYEDLVAKKPGEAITRLFSQNAFYHLREFRDL